VWSILDEGELVGNCTLWQVDRTDQLDAAVGYRTAPWARGRGIATAAVRAISRWAFDHLGLERIELVHTVANVASCTVAERAGFTLEGLLRQDYRTTDGSRWDTHVHGLLRSDQVP
jgi:RimJ/RimL family protein N-acetyltransferase